MPRFVIEREIPGCGQWPPERLRAVAGTSNQAIREPRAEDPPAAAMRHRDKVGCV